MAERVKLARRLEGVFEREKKPFIVAGDFNMPDHGWIHRFFAARLTDAFATAGSGWGATFPGDSEYPFSFRGPWLRIDYIFAGRGFRPVYARVEQERRSEHRAVAARLARVAF